MNYLNIDHSTHKEPEETDGQEPQEGPFPSNVAQLPDLKTQIDVFFKKFITGRPIPSYDRYKIPACIKKARLHASAVKLNHIEAAEYTNYNEICECCSLRVPDNNNTNGKTNILPNIWKRKHDIKNDNEYDVFIYFEYTKSLIYLLLLLILGIGIPFMLMNIACYQDNNNTTSSISHIILTLTGFNLLLYHTSNSITINALLIHTMGILSIIILGLMCYMLIKIINKLMNTISMNYYQNNKYPMMRQDYHWVIYGLRNYKITKSNLVGLIKSKFEEKLNCIPEIIRIQYLPDLTQFRQYVEYYIKYKPIVIQLELESMEYLHIKTFAHKLKFYFLTWLPNRISWILTRPFGLIYNVIHIKEKLNEIMPVINNMLMNDDPTGNLYFKYNETYDDDSISSNMQTDEHYHLINCAIITFNTLIKFNDNDSNQQLDLGNGLVAKLIPRNTINNTGNNIPKYYLFTDEALNFAGRVLRKISNIMPSLFILILAILFTFCIIMLQNLKNSSTICNILIDIFSSLCIIWSNKLLQSIYYKISQQSPSSSSLYGPSLFIFINIIISYILFTTKTTYTTNNSGNEDNNQDDDLLLESDKIEEYMLNLQSFFIVYNLIYPLFNLINPLYLYKCYQRRCILSYTLPYTSSPQPSNSNNNSPNKPINQNNEIKLKENTLGSNNHNISPNNYEFKLALQIQKENANDKGYAQEIRNEFINENVLDQENDNASMSSNIISHNIPQYRMNEIFEGIKFDYTERYTVILINMLFTMFLCALIPHTLFISLIGLIITLFIDRYIIYSRSIKWNKHLPIILLMMIIIFPIIFACGFSSYSSLFTEYNDDGTLDGYATFLSILAGLLTVILFTTSIIHLKKFTQTNMKYSYREICMNIHPSDDFIPSIYQKPAQIAFLNRLKNLGGDNITEELKSAIDERIVLINQLQGEALLNYLIADNLYVYCSDESAQINQHQPIQNRKLKNLKTVEL